MRIALVIYGRPEQISGGFIYDRALVAALTARKHRVDVVSLPWHGYARAVAGSVIGAGPPTADSDGAKPYDIVIEDELIHPSVFTARASSGLAARGRVRVALVHNLRSGQPGEGLRAIKTAVERRYFDGVAGAIAVCTRTRDDLGALLGRPLPCLVARPGRDHVAPGIGDNEAAARAVEPGPLRVLHVAAVQPHKGLDRFLAAMARARGGARAPEFTLDVVGASATGRYARRIRRQIAALDLGARVQFHGLLRGAALHALFRRSQTFALPSEREAYSLACLEALGYGLPVLATSKGGLGEMIAHGGQGFLIDPADTEAMAARLVELATDRGRLREMSLAALARYRAHGTWAEVAASVEDFLTALQTPRSLSSTSAWSRGSG
jgi:glycosyltransferase involved in cell wall biosynthesis